MKKNTKPTSKVRKSTKTRQSSNKNKVKSASKSLVKAVVTKKTTSKPSLIKSSKTEKLLNCYIPKVAWYGALVLGFVFFLLYLFTAPKTNVAYTDSDLFLTVAYKLGLAEPPGVPLYMVLLHFFLNLPIPGSIAFRGHFLSTLLHTGSLVIVFVSVWRLIQFLQNNNNAKLIIVSKQVDRWLVSGIATASLGSSYLFWQYGIVAEKYAFIDLLVAAVIGIGVYVATTAKSKTNLSYWYALAGLIGILVIHHPISFVLLPFVATLVWLKKDIFSRKQYMGMVLSLLVSISISIGVLLGLNALEREINWNFKPTVKETIDYVFTQGFSRSIAENFEEYSAFAQISSGSVFKSLMQFGKVFVQHFGLGSVALLVVGIAFLYSSSKKMSLVILSGWTTVGLLLPVFLKWPESMSFQALRVRDYLMGYMFTPLLVGLGGWMVLARFNKALKILLQNNRVSTGVTLVVPALILIVSIVNTFKHVNLRNFTVFSRFHESVLENLPHDALIGCFTDTTCSALLYEQEVKGVRKDVIIVSPSHQLIQKKLNSIDNLKGFDYTNNTWLVHDYLTWNIGKRPVYVIDLPKTYYNLLGLTYGFTYYIPNGYVGELTREVPEVTPSVKYSFSEEIENMNVPSKDLMRTWLKTSYAQLHYFNAVMYLKMDYRSLARSELNTFSNILHQVEAISNKEIEDSRSYVEGSHPLVNFSPGSEVQPLSEIMNGVNAYLNDGKLQRAYTGALGIITIDPLNEEGRLKLAEIYEKMGNTQMAKVEYQHVLKYYPSNTQAQTKLAELK